MARTTAVLVAKIKKVREGDDLSPFIETATDLVDSKCLASGYDADKLEMIERYLAAHFYETTLKRAEHSQGIAAGPMRSFESNKLDFYLYNSTYGQNAMTLDTDGNLAAYANTLMKVEGDVPSAAARTFWLGSRTWRT